MEVVLDAVRTEGAFEGTDARFRRMRRKILVAIFAVRSKLQRHGHFVLSKRGGSSQITGPIRMANTPRFQPRRLALPRQLLRRQGRADAEGRGAASVRHSPMCNCTSEDAP